MGGLWVLWVMSYDISGMCAGITAKTQSNCLTGHRVCDKTHAMKFISFLLATIVCHNSNAQDKSITIYNKVTELQGSSYVIASVEDQQKMAVENKYLLFINTVTGESRQLDVPATSYLERFEQVKIDSHKINKVIVVARTVNLNGNKAIDYYDPRQVIICSTDGIEKVQITEDSFYVSSFTIHRQTGNLVITGHYDTNKNGKIDKGDKSEILLYDLKKMEVIKRI